MAGPDDVADARDWRDLNHAWWDERAPLHAGDSFYDLDGIRAGRPRGLRNFEWELIGSVDGLEVVHPQCHLGTDTLSLAQRGARTVGLDFSANAVEAAREFAESLDLVDRTEWIVTDVYDAVEAVGGRTFDLVYTGLGALCWLPDVDRWAAAMAGLCRPGGSLHLTEFHPLHDTLGDDDTDFARDYFQAGGEVFDEPGSYATDRTDTTADTIVDFIHSLGEVMTAVLDHGFSIRALREYDFTVVERWPWLVHGDDDLYRIPADRPNMPLLYSLVADKPV